MPSWSSAAHRLQSAWPLFVIGAWCRLSLCDCIHIHRIWEASRVSFTEPYHSSILRSPFNLVAKISAARSRKTSHSPAGCFRHYLVPKKQWTSEAIVSNSLAPSWAVKLTWPLSFLNHDNRLVSQCPTLHPWCVGSRLLAATLCY